MTQPETRAAGILEEILAEARGAASVTAMRRNRSLRSSLKTLGFAAHADFLRALTASRPRSLCHFDVSALRAISRDRSFCRLLRGSFLSETLLYLLSHEAIRRKVTRRFLLDMNQLPASKEEATWMAVDPLLAAMGSGLVRITRISSLRSYLELAKLARKRLNSPAFKLPPPPFALPQGWTWFKTGADFRTLTDHSPADAVRRMESHCGVVRCEGFLLRDPSGHGWKLLRLPPPP